MSLPSATLKAKCSTYCSVYCTFWYISSNYWMDVAF